MWLISKHGFLSIVKHRSKTHTLIVRGRAKEDVCNAARMYGEKLHPDLTPEGQQRLTEVLVNETPDADYRYRFEADCNLFESVMLELIRSVDYPNFKNEVARVQGYDRAHVYTQVWTDLLALDTREKRNFFRDPDTIDLFEEGEDDYELEDWEDAP